MAIILLFDVTEEDHVKFSTRDLGWTLLTVGLTLGWYIDRCTTIEMFDGLIRQQFNFKHTGGYVPYGRYVPMSPSDDRIRFELEAERMVASKLASLQVDVQLADGRWIAQIPDVGGVMASGESRDQATKRVRMITALVLLNGRRIYFPSDVTTPSDELFPDIDKVIE